MKRVPLPFSNTYLPHPETLKQLCFVTGADSKSFPWMCQTLASIKNTKYNGYPICILDLGLQPQEISFLKENFSVYSFVNPGWDIPISASFFNKKSYQGLTARPFLGVHFPQFRYHFWIDSDAWVQEGDVIDQYILLCEKQGLGIAQHPTRNFFNSTKWHKSGLLSKEDDEFLKRKPLVSTGILCLDSESEIAESWGKLSFALGREFQTLYNEIALMITLYKTEEEYEILKAKYFHAVPDQLTTDREYNLYADDRYAGFIHLMGTYKKEKTTLMRLHNSDEAIDTFCTFEIS